MAKKNKKSKKKTEKKQKKKKLVLKPIFNSWHQSPPNQNYMLDAIHEDFGIDL